MPDNPIPTNKRFWQTPEGKTGLVPLVLAGAAIVYFWGKILPFLVTAADNTLHLIVVMAAIWAIIFVAIDKDIRRFIFYLYKSLMRYITGLFVEIDPIGVRKTYRDRLKDQLSEFDTALGDIRGVKVTLDRNITENRNELDRCMSLLAAAKKTSDVRQLKIQGPQSERLERRLEKRKKSLANVLVVIEILTRYREVSDDTITNLTNEINDMEIDRRESSAFSKGMRKAFNILHGLPEEKEMDDMARETLERQYSEQIGECEQVISITRDIISTANLEDSAAVERALEKLKTWQGTDATVGKTSKSEIIDSATKKAAVTGLLDVQNQVNDTEPSSEYKKLFS